MKHPHIIYLHTHDSGRFWSPYGYAVRTPNVMDQAQRSVLFRQCYDCGPTCAPSRTAMLTGITPHENGMIGLPHRGFKLNDWNKHLANYLKSQGYHTVLSGVHHEARSSLEIGYDEVLGKLQDFDHGPNPDTVLFDERNVKALCDFLDARNLDKEPLFVSMGFNCTHRTYPADDGSVNPDYLAVPSCIPDTRETRKDFAGFVRSVQAFDQNLGKVLAKLKDKDLLENSIVLLTTDHGIAFPWMKCNLYDTGIGVACMLSYPGNPMRGKVSDALVSQLDIYPTLCELAGIPKPKWLEGLSLCPLLEGKVDNIRNEIFSEVTYHAAYEPQRCIRTDRYKLIKRFGDFDHVVLSNIDASASKDFLLKNGLRNFKPEKAMLFDLYFDPNERRNLYDDPAYAAIRDDLLARLKAWMVQTNDPLLKGSRVPKPKGALVNKQTCECAETEDWEDD